MTELEKKYTDFYLKGNPAETYPNEYLIRTFWGNYPELSLDKNYKDKKVLDLGMGDGRNLRFLAARGFNAFGIEINEDICSHVASTFKKMGIEATLKSGLNDSIPFEDSFFDYLVSWNSSYYMGDRDNYYAYRKNTQEFARVLKPGGKLVLSVPGSNNFIYQNSLEIEPGYKIIENDPYKARNGQVFKFFKSKTDVQKDFEADFENFVYAELQDDCFGQNNHYIIMVCDKKLVG